MTTSSDAPISSLSHVVIRFAGDSGDGIQLTGGRFTETSAIVGNDVATLPDYPAEIRAPAGTLPGVSGFQLQFASEDIYTAGDRPDVLVAMNPAALARNVGSMAAGATLIVDQDAFTDRNLKRAGYTDNPLEDGTLAALHVHNIPMTSLTLGALEEIKELTKREKERCKNFFALGLTCWMFSRPLEPTIQWINGRFGEDTAVAAANREALRKGWDFGLTTEAFAHQVEVKPAPREPGVWRNITGNQATAIGFLAAANAAKRELFLGSYPITPATDILHELSKHLAHGVQTFQAEDEIAAICATIGAAWGGAVALTTSSGPGISLKSEAIGLALMAELPIIIANIQRGGPSTGLPTKTEQSDLYQALFGRHGEAPLAVIAASCPSDAFTMAFEAVRIATKWMTPVMFLSDGYIGNGSEPWKVPNLEDLPDLSVEAPAAPEDGSEPDLWSRDPVTFARKWISPGIPGLEHRLGGLERSINTGHISYDPSNHEQMVEMRQAKIDSIALDIPLLEVDKDNGAETLLVGWGGTEGALRSATKAMRERGHKIDRAHFHYLNPFPRNTEEVLRGYSNVIVAELNSGQLSSLIQARYVIPVQPLTKIQGQPFNTAELVERLVQILAKAA